MFSRVIRTPAYSLQQPHVFIYRYPSSPSPLRLKFIPIRPQNSTRRCVFNCITHHRFFANMTWVAKTPCGRRDLGLTKRNNWYIQLTSHRMTRLPTFAPFALFWVPKMVHPTASWTRSRKQDSSWKMAIP